MGVTTLDIKELLELEKAAKGVYALPRQLNEQDKQKTKDAIRAIKEGKFKNKARKDT